MTQASTLSHPLLRKRDGHHARVTYEELVFDLVYVFAVTQLSHSLLHHLTLGGLVETVILWFAVWLGWQYTCWMTNWFNPEAPRIRMLMFGMMFAGLILSSSIPSAFGNGGLVFALAYVAIQWGRTAYIVFELGSGHPLTANYRRMLGWLSISAIFWIAGGLSEGAMRPALWAIAVVCEYFSPMIGFALPGLGRSRTSDWTIEGAHLTERCQLFVIVALGETLLATGVVLAQTEIWSPAVISALLATFLGTLAMWWLYFATSSKDATETITHCDDPGRLGAYFHYVHAILIAGIIATAVGNDLTLAHPHDHVKLSYALVLCAGPAVYLLGSALYKKIVYGRIPLSHFVGVAVLLALLTVAEQLDLLTLSWITTLIMLAIGFWDWRQVTRKSMRA